MLTTVYLVRHGETDGNRVRRYQPYDMPLSDLGREQARLVAERLAVEGPFTALYASDLARTMETATAIAGSLELAPRPEPRFRELDTGDFKGSLYDDIEARHPGMRERWIAGGGVERLPGAAGESTTDVHRRVTEAFEELVALHAGERIIVVSHGWALAMLLAALHNVEHTEAFREQRFPFGNTSVTIVEIEGDTRRCVLINSTGHLEAGATWRAPRAARKL